MGNIRYLKGLGVLACLLILAQCGGGEIQAPNTENYGENQEQEEAGIMTEEDMDYVRDVGITKDEVELEASKNSLDCETLAKQGGKDGDAAVDEDIGCWINHLLIEKR